MRFVLVRSRLPRRQRWRWLIVADNGRTLASSEAYTNRADCEAAVEIVRNHAHAAPIRSEP
jgi:uncharacterized protein YegP (UPF0339 family)